MKIRKYIVLLAILISTLLLIIASLLYPGGSLYDKQAPGFDWTKNFFSNLFEATAINGQPNPGRIWAVIGMAFHSIGYGLFFRNTARKMPMRHASIVLNTVGIANMVFSFLIATPLHDIMIVVSSTLTLLGIFYITVFTLKTKLHILKAACILCMLIFYFTLYLYGAGDWGLLAVMQKVSLVVSLALVLGIEYGTRAEDFFQKQNPSIPTR